MDRELDGVFFRVNRGRGFESVCFSDLTEEERKIQLQGRTTEWLESLCLILGRTIKDIGDDLNIFKTPPE